MPHASLKGLGRQQAQLHNVDRHSFDFPRLLIKIRLVGYGRLTFTTRALEEAGQRISRYLLMQTIINSSFGLVLVGQTG